QQRQAGVAVVVDLLDVVLELVPGERRDALFLHLWIPVLARESGEAQQLLVLEVIANEMGLDIENELSGQALRPRQHQLWLVRLGRVDLKYVAIDLVHGEKGAAAMPQLVCMNCRRLRPSRLPLTSASSRIRCSTRFCVLLCGGGRYSPFDTIWVGIGVAAEAASAPATRRCSRSLSQLLIVLPP